MDKDMWNVKCKIVLTLYKLVEITKDKGIVKESYFFEIWITFSFGNLK